jgi:formylglycine-generating enzyme required for sulfatase activity
MQRSIFLSCAGAELVHAHNLAALLRAAELPVVCSSLDDNALGGPRLWDELERTIQSCDVFIALCGDRGATPAALAELTAAVARNDREPAFPIGPALVGQLAPEQVPPPLRPHQYIVLPPDLLDASNAEREELVRQFRGLLRVKQEPSADRLWQRAAERVAAHAEYAGMALRAQTGLTPLGPDPVSRLEEFAVHGSGAPLVRGANGRLQWREDSAVVLVLAPSGEFWMGASDAELDARISRAAEHPRHRVALHPFFVAKTPITQLQFACVMGWSRARRRGARLPASELTWREAATWCARVGLELPSEAQWEYACRARSTTRYSSGEREEDLARVGWFAGNSHGELQDVGLLAPNRFGLHDCHGSVWEWCADSWHTSYVNAPAHGGAWPGADRESAVARGGSFFGPALHARSAERRAFRMDEPLDTLGFRPVRSVQE